MSGLWSSKRRFPDALWGQQGQRAVRIIGARIVWSCLLLFIAQSGCSGLAKRYQRDDFVTARQIARQGADAFHAGDWARAQEYYSKAVEACPIDERVRARYAETLWNRGLRRDAIEHQQEAVRLSGGDPELKVRLGEMYVVQGDLSHAVFLADQVIHSGQELASAHRLRGDVLVQQGKWLDALAAYHRALSTRPDYPEVQMAVAQVYQRNGRPQRALSTLQSLANTYPPGEEPAELLYWEGMAFASLGRHPQAVQHFALAESRGMQSADLQLRLAESHHLLGDRMAARTALERAMRMDRSHPQTARLSATIQGTQQLARVPD